VSVHLLLLRREKYYDVHAHCMLLTNGRLLCSGGTPCRYAWIGYSWSMCGMHYAWPEELDADYGVPAGDCAEVGETEVFQRRWSKADVSLDCRAFEGKITPQNQPFV